MARGKKGTRGGKAKATPKEEDNQDLTMETEETEDSQIATNDSHIEDDVEAEVPNNFLEQITAKGIVEKSAEQLNDLIKNENLTLAEITDEVVAAFAGLDEYKASSAINEFAESDLAHITDKPAHLLTLLKTWKDNPEVTENSVIKNESDPSPAKPVPDPEMAGPNEEKLKLLLERTGYKHEVTPGQRHYGPPPGHDGEAPGHGNEVFIGKLPRDVFEDELVPLVEEKVGADDIFDVRLMIDSTTGHNRGFAFVCFITKEAMRKCVKELNDYEIRPGKQIKVNLSTPNLRLFVGNLPKTRGREEILEEFKTKTDGLMDVIIYGIADDPKKKNRGFAFLEYETHHAAAAARKRLSRMGTRVWNNEIVVDWAEPQEEPDEETMAKVKILYVKNLTTDTTEETIKETFEKYGKVEKIKKVKDYAFVHFDERDDAIKAMDALNMQEIGPNKVEISLAKPVSDWVKQKKEQRRSGMRGMYSGPFDGGRGRGGWGSPGGPRGGMGAPRGFRPPFGGRGGGGGFGPSGGMGGMGRGGFGPRRGMMSGPPMGGGDMWGGWYNGGYYEDSYYPPPMGGMRGGMGGGGYGAPRGWGAPRGAMGFGRGGPRGMPPRGNRGGFRGGPRGGAERGGFKRKQTTPGQDSKKPKVEGSTEWGSQPIAQQPLQGVNQAAGNNGSGEQWYQDSFPAGATW